ncbi:MAG: TonB family protein [Deferrisomatales bacterium]
MRLHRYPGLYGDSRSGRLWAAVAVSVVLHAGLFMGYSRFHIRPVSRTFFAPVQMVDLRGGTPSPKPAGGTQPAEAAPGPLPPAKPEPPTKPEPKKPEPKPPEAPAPKAPEPPPKPKAEIKPADAKAIPKEPADPKPKAPTEERVAERIDEIRKKLAPAAAAPTPAPPRPAPEETSRVQDAVERIRQKVGTQAPAAAPGAGTGGPAPAGAGVRSAGANVLQEVRLRSYYNRLWEHVNGFWAIPPSLQGRGYTVIVSVVIDRQGRVVKSWIEEPSKSPAFDQSALSALERAQPLPAPPPEIPDEWVEVGFRFHGE